MCSLAAVTRVGRPDMDTLPAQPDGYVVIASKLAPASVKPPYSFMHWHEWRADLEGVAIFYVEVSRDEYGPGWGVKAVLPTFGGIPRREMALSVMELARLAKETEAA